MGYLRTGRVSSCRFADIVKFIRQNLESFEEWYRSETTKLFTPTFHNEIKASAISFNFVISKTFPKFAVSILSKWFTTTYECNF